MPYCMGTHIISSKMAEAEELPGVLLHQWLDKHGHDQLPSLTCFVLLYYDQRSYGQYSRKYRIKFQLLLVSRVGPGFSQSG